MTTETELMLLDVAEKLAVAAWAKYKDAKSGKLDPARALADLTASVAALTSGLAGNDAAADAALDSKFPTGEP